MTVGRSAIAVVLLGDDPTARRLVATWAVAAAAFEADPVAGRQAWSKLSGVDIEDLVDLEEVLFGNGIISAGGAVDDEAVKVLNAFGAETLRRMTTGRRR